MQPEDSLPCLKELATDLYPEPDESKRRYNPEYDSSQHCVRMLTTVR